MRQTMPRKQQKSKDDFVSPVFPRMNSVLV